MSLNLYDKYKHLLSEDGQDSTSISNYNIDNYVRKSMSISPIKNDHAKESANNILEPIYNAVGDNKLYLRPVFNFLKTVVNYKITENTDTTEGDTENTQLKPLPTVDTANFVPLLVEDLNILQKKGEVFTVVDYKNPNYISDDNSAIQEGRLMEPLHYYFSPCANIDSKTLFLLDQASLDITEKTDKIIDNYSDNDWFLLEGKYAYQDDPTTGLKIFKISGNWSEEELEGENFSYLINALLYNNNLLEGSNPIIREKEIEPFYRGSCLSAFISNYSKEAVDSQNFLSGNEITGVRTIESGREFFWAENNAISNNNAIINPKNQFTIFTTPCLKTDLSSNKNLLNLLLEISKLTETSVKTNEILNNYMLSNRHENPHLAGDKLTILWQGSDDFLSRDLSENELWDNPYSDFDQNGTQNPNIFISTLGRKIMANNIGIESKKYLENIFNILKEGNSSISQYIENIEKSYEETYKTLGIGDINKFVINNSIIINGLTGLKIVFCADSDYYNVFKTFKKANTLFLTKDTSVDLTFDKDKQVFRYQSGNKEIELSIKARTISIDHIDGNHYNNKVTNLRLTTKGANNGFQAQGGYVSFELTRTEKQLIKPEGVMVSWALEYDQNLKVVLPKGKLEIPIQAPIQKKNNDSETLTDLGFGSNNSSQKKEGETIINSDNDENNPISNNTPQISELTYENNYGGYYNLKINGIANNSTENISKKDSPLNNNRMNISLSTHVYEVYNSRANNNEISYFIGLPELLNSGFIDSQTGKEITTNDEARLNYVIQRGTFGDSKNVKRLINATPERMNDIVKNKYGTLPGIIIGESKQKTLFNKILEEILEERGISKKKVIKENSGKYYVKKGYEKSFNTKDFIQNIAGVLEDIKRIAKETDYKILENKYEILGSKSDDYASLLLGRRSDNFITEILKEREKGLALNKWKLAQYCLAEDGIIFKQNPKHSYTLRVSNYGRIAIFNDSKKTCQIVGMPAAFEKDYPTITPNNYGSCPFYEYIYENKDEGEGPYRKSLQTHIVVASTCCNPPECFENRNVNECLDFVVHHINGNKNDYRPDNLEWVNHCDNTLFDSGTAVAIYRISPGMGIEEPIAAWPSKSAILEAKTYEIRPENGEGIITIHLPTTSSQLNMLLNKSQELKIGSSVGAGNFYYILREVVLIDQKGLSTSTPEILAKDIIGYRFKNILQGLDDQNEIVFNDNWETLSDEEIAKYYFLGRMPYNENFEERILGSERGAKIEKIIEDYLNSYVAINDVKERAIKLSVDRVFINRFSDEHKKVLWPEDEEILAQKLFAEFINGRINPLVLPEGALYYLFTYYIQHKYSFLGVYLDNKMNSLKKFIQKAYGHYLERAKEMYYIKNHDNESVKKNDSLSLLKETQQNLSDLLSMVKKIEKLTL